MPIGAIAGRADVMDVFTGLGAQRGIFSGGTFSGNPMTMAAGAAAVGYLKAHPEIYPCIERRRRPAGASRQRVLQRAADPGADEKRGRRCSICSSSANRSKRCATSARGNTAAEKAFYLHALNRGVLVPGTQRAFLSAAHSRKDVDTLIEVFTASLIDVEADGLFEH